MVELQEKQDITIDWFFKVGIGVLGLPFADLLNMRLGEFFLRVEGFYQKQYDLYKQNAELIRLQTYWLINIQLPHNKQLSSPVKLWSFAWDENKAVIDTRTDAQIIDDNKKLFNLATNGGGNNQQSEG